MISFDLAKVAFASILSVAILFLLTKMLGYKQMSELSMFDYVNGISIGSIAAEMATTIDGDFLKPILAMVIYAVVGLLISIISSHSLKSRRFLEGSTILLFENGKFYRDNFTKAKLDISEFLTQCRIAGYFDINDISIAMMESNGKISILPTNAARPVNVDDMNSEMRGLNPKKPSKVCVNVIVDGIILYENLKHTGNNDVWLNNELKRQGFSDANEVFLGMVDENNKLNVYKKTQESPENDLFQ